MTIYIDSDYKCYTTAGEGRTAVEFEFFDGKCERFIEGYRFIPDGSSWTRADGIVFKGEAVFPWQNSDMLLEIQKAYEAEADMRSALELLEVSE